MKQRTFATLADANEFRRRAGQYLANSDDKRSKTVYFTDRVPNTVLSRADDAVYQSQQGARQSSGQAELTAAERQSLSRGTGFQWQQHGFGAMAAKAALEERGATEWLDFYEPGEGVEGALQNLRASKGRSQQTGAGIGVGGMRTDMEEQSGGGRRRRQAERASADRIQSAKRPALFGLDEDAIGFLREEQQFGGGGDLFDISFGGEQPSGRDYDTLLDRNEQRTERAQYMDTLFAAPTTRDPLTWTQDPTHWDFPGIDTLDPQAKHAARSERAQRLDESRQAETADSVEQWAKDMDSLDLPGVDSKLLR